MSIKPPGAYLTFVDSTSASLFIDSIEVSFQTEEFERKEFSNDLYREARTVSGARPQFSENIAGEPVQTLYACTGDTPRSPAPDDANVDSIKRRFEKTVYKVTGAVGPASSVDQVQVWAAEHMRRVSKFNLHLAKAQMGLSVTALDTMRLEDFDYLLSSGTDVYAASVVNSDFPTGWIEDILIVSFTQGIEYEIPNSSGGTDLYKAFSLVFEKRVNVAQSFTN